MAELLMEQFEDILAEVSWEHVARSARIMRVACCLVWVETALIDSHYSEEEYHTMVQVLLQHLGARSQEDAEHYIGLAEYARQHRSRLTDAVGVIRARFSERDRCSIYGIIWKVIKADGKVHESELRLVTELGRRLGLTVEQEIEARREVAAQAR